MDYLELNSRKLLFNLKYWQQLAESNGASLNVVTKFCLSNPSYIQLLFENGVKTVSDSNIQNFQGFPEPLKNNITRCGIKTRVSDIKLYENQADDTLIADRLLVSDEAVLKAVENLPENKRPDIVLIMECGDYKDGLYQNDIKSLVKKYKNLPIIGVSANFACLSGKMPDLQSIQMLSETAQFIQKEKKLEKPFVSVGGTVMHDILVSGILSTKEYAGLISEIRCGEGIFFGYNSSKGEKINQLNQDVFQFKAEILELQWKDIPETKNEGLNALGEHSESRPSGRRLCAVLDFGILAASLVEIFAKDADTLKVGQTFDFTVVDVTSSKNRYVTGDFIQFNVNYASASFMCMNRFISKTIA